MGKFLLALATGLFLSMFYGLGGFAVGFVLAILIQVLAMTQDASSLRHDPHQARVEMERKLEQFLNVTFEVMGHLSKAKGVVTQEDIAQAQTLMNKMHLQGRKRVVAQTAFNAGKNHSYPLQHRIRMLRTYYSNEPTLLRFFLETQINVACHDGQIHPKEWEILRVIAVELGIDVNLMEQHLYSAQASFHFQRNHRASYDHHRSHQSENRWGNGNSTGREQSSYETRQGDGELMQAYKVLCVTPGAEDTAIKNAYRRLMNEHHPDKLVSRGLPPEMMDLAKQRTQEIQSAYELVKAHRGFK